MEKRSELSECGRREEQQHPESSLLLRFMAGGVSRLENLEVVRHLLAGCPQCVAVTRRAWQGDGASLEVFASPSLKLRLRLWHAESP
jgi:hypothetical protein